MRRSAPLSLAALCRSVPMFAALAVLAAASGCNAMLPANLAALGGSQEKEIVRQAEVDPFPSPSDVGISSPEATP